MILINIGLKTAVERSLSSKLEDARDALTNKMVDILGVYKSALTSSQSGASPQLQICNNLKLLPLLSLGLLKHVRMDLISCSYVVNNPFFF